MIPRHLLRKPHLYTSSCPPTIHHTTRRFLSSPKPPPTTPSPRSRLDKVLSRIPKPLRKYTTPLQNAPTTSILTFLILHEITAIIPLVGLAGFFHWSGWIPSFSSLDEKGYVKQGVERFGRYFAKKGWFGFGGQAAAGELGEGEGDGMGNGVGVGVVGEGVLGNGEGDIRVNGSGGSYGSRILLEVAMAYAITKVLLPVRILGCVWATPVVVGWVGRARALVGRRS